MTIHPTPRTASSLRSSVRHEKKMYRHLCNAAVNTVCSCISGHFVTLLSNPHYQHQGGGRHQAGGRRQGGGRRHELVREAKTPTQKLA